LVEHLLSTKEIPEQTFNIPPRRRNQKKKRKHRKKQTQFLSFNLFHPMMMMNSIIINFRALLLYTSALYIKKTKII